MKIPTPFEDIETPVDGLKNAPQARLPWPEVQIVGPRQYELLADYQIEWRAEGFPLQRLVVPAKFLFDGASIPAILEWYLGRERILPAAVIHDWQYAFAGHIPSESHLYLDDKDGLWKPTGFVWSRKDCDRFFARNLKFCDIRDGQRRNAYRAVRLFGWIPWRRARSQR